jgi:hypothetical protein
MRALLVDQTPLFESDHPEFKVYFGFYAARTALAKSFPNAKIKAEWAPHALTQSG